MKKAILYHTNVVSSSKETNYLLNNYYIILSLSFFIIALLDLFIKIIPLKYIGFIIIFGFTSLTVKADINKNVDLKSFLHICIPFVIFILTLMTLGGYIWHEVLKLEIRTGNLFNLNNIFDKIPYNDGSIFRLFSSSWLTTYMKAVYSTGFVLAVVVPLYRALISLDFNKMLKYTLATHVLQVFIITPFYFTFKLQEVWYVRGHHDMLARKLNYRETIETTLNCFPSMHTSIAFAVFLLVLREKDTIFKLLWSIYCFSIIYSTMYLEIHWCIDILGGLFLGYCTIKLVDFIWTKDYFKNIGKSKISYKNKSTNVRDA